MARLTYALALGLSALALTACDSKFDQEVGSSVNTGDFGNATLNNALVQSGDQGYTLTLGRRFAETVPPTITFAFNSSALTDEARATLSLQANFIRQFPEVRFRVYGHTDLVGSNAYNKALGLRRAQAVVSYFSSVGISRSRLEAVVSYGKTQPVIQTPGPEQRNRRTVTEVSGFVGSNPLILNGKYAEVIFREYLKSGETPHPDNTKVTNELSPGQ